MKFIFDNCKYKLLKRSTLKILRQLLNLSHKKKKKRKETTLTGAMEFPSAFTYASYLCEIRALWVYFSKGGVVTWESPQES